MAQDQKTQPIARRLAVIAVVLAAVAATSLAGCSSGGSEPAVLTIAADADIGPAVNQLAAAFEAANPGADVQVEIVDDTAVSEMATGDNTVDVIIASDLSALDGTESATALAENPLEIAVTLGNAAGITGIEDFADADLTIGLCSDDTPRGEAALQALAAAAVSASVDYTDPDVWEILARVEDGNLDAAIVWATDNTAEWGYVDVIAIPSEFQAAQHYEIAVLSNSDSVSDAENFVEFSLSTDGRDIIESYGMVAS